MFRHFFSPLLLFCFISLALAGEFYVDRMLLENVRNYYGKQAGKRMLAWQDLLVDSRGLPESQKLSRVNNFFNQLQFVSDQKHWGAEDYWATPVEFLVSEIKPAGQRKDLQPVYNFNGDGLWLARERGKGALRVGEAERISLWSNVRKR